MLLDELRALLLTLNSVTALVGAGAEARIRPGNLDENDDYPAIVVNIERQSNDQDLDSEAGLVEATVMITCLSYDVTEAWSLREKVRVNDTDPGTGVAGYRGTPITIDIDVSHVGDVHDSAPLDDGSDRYVHAVGSEYTIWFNEPV